MYFRHLGHRIGAVSHGDRSITYFRTAVLEKGEGRTCNTQQAVKTMRLRDETAPKPLCSLVERKRRIGFVATRPVMLVINCGCIESLTKSS